jgi:HD-GYP domain-containing protein (c-di-GMP phosphodiesterase class II)
MILNMPYVAVNKMTVGPSIKVDGIAINPFSNNLILKKELLQRIDEVDQQRAEAMKNGQAAAGAQPQVRELKLTPQQYVVFERKQYEFRFLPKKLFEEGKTFIEELSSKKEEYIDALYEESYQQKRMYPYLTEDFSVLAIQISGTTQMIRVDMPARDLEDGACRRVFIAWNQETETGRYFTIEKAGNGSVLAEVTSDWRHKNLGEAPVEGAELQRILELVEQNA